MTFSFTPIPATLGEFISLNTPDGGEVASLLSTTFWMILGIAFIFAIYLVFSGFSWLINQLFENGRDKAKGYTSLKTVTFGDESAVVANRFASVASVIAIFFFWALATGSSLLGPIQLPAPFLGETSFEYTAVNAAGETDTGKVNMLVHTFDDKPTLEKADNSASGFAKDAAVKIRERRTALVSSKVIGATETEGYQITEVNGQPIAANGTVDFGNGEVLLTAKGSLQVRPYAGMTMEALYLPSPEKVWKSFLQLNKEGYTNVGLWENVFWSLIRVFLGFALGCLFGIPLGFAMGLSNWFRGWFDPIVEFMRPVPPLALIPLIIIWFGIGEQGKISLLFLAALWIMTIAARAGVSGVNITKVHAAYSLGATKRQLLMKVILPNSLPEIFTGARVAMGVCWGTVVAAELVAAEKGAGKMIIAASKFQLTDIVIIGIIIIGVIGFAIEVLMRKMENRLIPWKGRG
jgi:taurine transport system permease protein